MPKHLKVLSPRHHDAIRRRVAGSDPREIADALGVALRTVYLWFSDPLVKDEFQRTLLRINDELAQRVAEHGLQALETLGTGSELLAHAADERAVRARQEDKVLRELE